VLFLSGGPWCDLYFPSRYLPFVVVPQGRKGHWMPIVRVHVGLLFMMWANAPVVRPAAVAVPTENLKGVWEFVLDYPGPPSPVRCSLTEEFLVVLRSITILVVDRQELDVGLSAARASTSVRIDYLLLESSRAFPSSIPALSAMLFSFLRITETALSTETLCSSFLFTLLLSATVTFSVQSSFETSSTGCTFLLP
jgi:hypothetical protein